MQLNKYIYEIRNLTGLEDIRYIIRLIELNRALYYRNKLSNGEFVNDAAIQQISKVELELVEQSDSPIDLPSGFMILKSVKQIPRLLSVKHNHTIFVVRNLRILAKEFSFVTREEAVYSGSGRANTRNVFCFLHDGYLYVKLMDDNPRIALLDYVTIEGLFTTPTEVFEFEDGEADRDLYFREYPIDDACWLYIRNLIVNGKQESSTEAQA